MTPPERSGARVRVAGALGVSAAAVAVLAASIMLIDWIGATRRAPAEAARLLELEEQVRMDPAVAEVLGAERERQTEASLRREERNYAFAWVLLVAGGLAVAGGKWWSSARPPAAPGLSRLMAERFPPSAPLQRRQTAADAGEDSEVEEVAFVDELIARYGGGRESAIPLLQGIQTRFRHLPDVALQRVCERTEITPAQLAGTSSFYAQFRRSPVGRHVVRVCHGTACHVAGAGRITDELRRHLDIADGEDTDPKRLFTLDNVACLGCCSLAPVLMIGEDTAGRLTPATARGVIDALEPER